VKLPKIVVVVVADGERYLMLEKDETTPSGLRVVAVREHEVERNAEMGADRPGRFAQPSGRRETVEQTDWRRIGKEDFARRLAVDIAALGERPIVIVAGPRTMGVLRAALAEDVAARMVGEIPSDLTHHSLQSIADLIARA
jgi:protein required for attachment to host cells